MGAGQWAESVAAAPVDAGRTLLLAAARAVRRELDRRQQVGDHPGRDVVLVVGHEHRGEGVTGGHGTIVGVRGARRRHEEGVAGVVGQRPVGSHPGVEQPGGLECGLDAGGGGRVAAVGEPHQPPQRGAGAPVTAVAAPVHGRRCVVAFGEDRLAAVGEHLPLLGQRRELVLQAGALAGGLLAPGGEPLPPHLGRELGVVLAGTVDGGLDRVPVVDVHGRSVCGGPVPERGAQVVAGGGDGVGGGLQVGGGLLVGVLGPLDGLVGGGDAAIRVGDRGQVVAHGVEVGPAGRDPCPDALAHGVAVAVGVRVGPRDPGIRGGGGQAGAGAVDLGGHAPVAALLLLVGGLGQGVGLLGLGAAILGTLGLGRQVAHRAFEVLQLGGRLEGLAGLQRVAAGPVGGQLVVGGGDLGLGEGLGGASLVEGGVRGVLTIDRGGVGGGRLDGGVGAVARLGAQVAAVVGQERAGGVVGGGELVEVALDGLEVVEGPRHLLEQVVVQRPQAPRERVRQQPRVEVLGQHRPAQGEHEVEHGLVALGAQPEQGGVDPSAVLAGAFDHHVVAEHLGQLPAGHGAVVDDEVQVLADTAVGHEEPRDRRGAVALGPQADADGDVPRPVPGARARGGELHPGVAVAGVGAAPQQVVLHRAVLAGERVQPPRVQAPVQHEREEHLERLGLARSVGAPQDQPAVGEGEGVVDVVPQPDDAGAGGPEAGRRHGWASGSRESWGGAATSTATSR